MAKMTLSENTFYLIPEGTTIFKVTEVDDSKYEDFGKLEVKLQTAKGQKHTERFTLTKKDGELNEGALKAWSYFARTCLNNFDVNEIDTKDIVGCYVKCTVKHEDFEYTKGDKAGQTGKNVRLNDYATATGFENVKAVEVEVDEDEIDLDDFLD